MKKFNLLISYCLSSLGFAFNIAGQGFVSHEGILGYLCLSQHNRLPIVTLQSYLLLPHEDLSFFVDIQGKQWKLITYNCKKLIPWVPLYQVRVYLWCGDKEITQKEMVHFFNGGRRIGSLEIPSITLQPFLKLISTIREPLPIPLEISRRTGIELGQTILLMICGIGGLFGIFYFYRKRISSNQVRTEKSSQKNSERAIHQLRLIQYNSKEKKFAVLHLQEILGNFITREWNLDPHSYSSTLQKLLYLEKNHTHLPPEIRHLIRELIIRFQILQYANLPTETHQKIFEECLNLCKKFFEYHVNPQHLNAERR